MSLLEDEISKDTEGVYDAFLEYFGRWCYALQPSIKNDR